MSHAQGELIVDGKIVGYYEYNGTADIAQPKVYDTSKALGLEWRQGEWTKCTCGQPPVECKLYSDYGGGFFWDGEYCPMCKTLVGDLDPWGAGL